MKQDTNSTPLNEMFEIFVGAKETMESIANSKRGAVALNRNTHRWQTIDKDAKYEVREPKEGRLCYSLYSDKDLHKIAEDKNLII